MVGITCGSLGGARLGSSEGFLESNEMVGSLMGKSLKCGFCEAEKQEREYCIVDKLRRTNRGYFQADCKIALTEGMGTGGGEGISLGEETGAPSTIDGLDSKTGWPIGKAPKGIVAGAGKGNTGGIAGNLLMGLATGFSIEGFLESNKILGSLMGKLVKCGFCIAGKQERECCIEDSDAG